ncbi:MAG: transglycosylase SLT domain-containing protein [Burkholderiaceae bacterium]|jgi:membrane-bound lytic murein transglycosylase D|nr:transglycosylase SLT domain-containing protein [Burkholderiaceae bacterium]
MTYQHRFWVLSLSATFVALGLVSGTGLAGDLSLPKYSKDAQLAAFHSPINTTPPQRELIEDDPVTEVLSMYEVDVWARVRRGFAIPDLENRLVANHEAYYRQHPDYFNRTTARASRYLFYIVQELEKRNMPMELALLPFIESAFNPHARSSAKAEGMWQFIPSTGRHYDLTQSAFRDDRRAILSSTRAALDYLQNLYGMFGDWQLALAAYNWGEGSVRRAIKKNLAAGQSTDFNSLSHRMPAETRNYVPKLQAVKNLIARPDEYRISLPKIENQPYFVTITKTHDIDVKVAAQLAELPVDEFRSLNPQFGQYVITGGSDVHILLPKENAEKFKANLANWKQPLSSWTAYRVTETRETVESIAEKFDTTASVIRHANNIPNSAKLKFGSTVLVPKPASARHVQDIAPDLAENARIALEHPVVTKVVKVKVRKQDNLASIAKRYGTSVSDLKALNNLGGSKRLVVGSIIKVHAVVRDRSATRKTFVSKSGKKHRLASSRKTERKVSVVKAGKTTKSRNAARKGTRKQTLVANTAGKRKKDKDV